MKERTIFVQQMGKTKIDKIEDTRRNSSRKNEKRMQTMTLDSDREGERIKPYSDHTAFLSSLIPNAGRAILPNLTRKDFNQ